MCGFRCGRSFYSMVRNFFWILSFFISLFLYFIFFTFFSFGDGTDAIGRRWSEATPVRWPRWRFLKKEITLVFLLFCLFFPSAFSWTGFHRVLLGFTEFYRVSPSFLEVLPRFTGFYRVLLGFTGFYWVLLGFTEFYWVSVGSMGLWWRMREIY